MAGLEQAGEPERRYQELRLRVEQRHTAVSALDADVVGDVAVQELIEATDDLLAFEDRLPVLRDLPARALSLQLVRAGALAALLGGVMLVLGVWRDVLAAGWLLLLPVAGVGAFRMATLAVAPAAGRHRRQRYVAAACGAGCLLLAPAVALSGWVVGLFCALVAVLSLAALYDIRWGELRWRR